MSKISLSRSTIIGLGCGTVILFTAYLISHSGCFDCGWVDIDYCEYKGGFCSLLQFPGYLTLTPYYFILLGSYGFYEIIGFGEEVLLQKFVATFIFLAIAGWLGSRIGRWYGCSQGQLVE